MSTGEQKHSWKEAVTVYARPRVLGMLFLGFSAGLPFLLVFSTLGVWLAEAGASRTTIGFFSWIGIMYSVKVLWAPIVDRVHLPILKNIFGSRKNCVLKTVISGLSSSHWMVLKFHLPSTLIILS